MMTKHQSEHRTWSTARAPARVPWQAAPRVAALFVVAGLLVVGPRPAQATTAQTAVTVTPTIIVGPVIKQANNQPPSSAFCLANFGIACYGPADMRNQYDLNPLYGAGTRGAGETIAIFDSYGSPTIQSDLHTFDLGYGLPDPPSFQVLSPEGTPQLNYTHLPSPANFHNKVIGTEVGWAYETTLDVEWAHAIAPKASILLVTTPVQETEGVQGLQNILNAEQYVLSHHLANVFSQSFATTEQAFKGSSDQVLLQRFSQTYQQAAAQGVTVFAAAGDGGVANTDKQGRLFPFPTVIYPASDPYVTAVGGTEINPPPTSSAYPTITGYAPEQVWNDGYGAGGGGYSVVFARPNYQSGAVSGSMRAIPDVSYNAAVISAVNIYESFDPVVGAGWTPVAGTSAATPQWAGLAALADDYAASHGKAPVGFINPALYTIGRSSAYASDFHDITVGNNSFAGITGYSAGPGWDPASGWGTPDAAHLIPDLVATAG
jgi:subtilase family serine protease